MCCGLPFHVVPSYPQTLLFTGSPPTATLHPATSAALRIHRRDWRRCLLHCVPAPPRLCHHLHLSLICLQAGGMRSYCWNGCGTLQGSTAVVHAVPLPTCHVAHLPLCTPPTAVATLHPTHHTYLLVGYLHIPLRARITNYTRSWHTTRYRHLPHHHHHHTLPHLTATPTPLRPTAYLAKPCALYGIPTHRYVCYLHRLVFCAGVGLLYHRSAFILLRAFLQPTL